MIDDEDRKLYAACSTDGCEVVNPLTGEPGTLRPLPERELLDLAPRILPPNWRRRTPLDAETLVFESVSLRALLSAAIEEDGKRWAHVSLSRADGFVPSWDDIVEVRDAILGPQRLAVQIVAPRSEHYSRREVEVLHLWAPLDGSPLPNFLRARGGTL